MYSRCAREPYASPTAASRTRDCCSPPIAVAPAESRNEYDLVRRFFMDHPVSHDRLFRAASQQYAERPARNPKLQARRVSQKCHVGFVLSERFRCDEEADRVQRYFIRRLASETAPEYFSRGSNRDCALPSFANIAHRRCGSWRVSRTSRGLARGRVDAWGAAHRRVIRPRRLLAFRTVLETAPRPTVGSPSRRRAIASACLASGRSAISESDRLGSTGSEEPWAKPFRAGGSASSSRIRAVDEPAGQCRWRPANTQGMGTDPVACDPKRAWSRLDSRVHGIANFYIARQLGFSDLRSRPSVPSRSWCLALRLRRSFEAVFGARP